MASRNYFFGALAIAAALVLGVLTGGSWVEEAGLLALFGLVIAFDSFRRVETEISQEAEVQAPRGRVAHFVSIARTKESESLGQDASNPFEAALLKRGDWPSLSSKELGELRRVVLDGVSKFV